MFAEAKKKYVLTNCSWTVYKLFVNNVCQSWEKGTFWRIVHEQFINCSWTVFTRKKKKNFLTNCSWTIFELFMNNVCQTDLGKQITLISWPYIYLSIVMPSLWELRIREWSVAPTVSVRAPWALALMTRRLWRKVWCRLLRVADRTLRWICLGGLVKAYMHILSFSGIVHQSTRSVAECGHVAREMRGASGLSVYIT